MAETKLKKLKIDPNQLLEDISKTLKGFNVRLEAIEQKPQPESMPLIQAPSSEFVFNAQSTSINEPGDTESMRKAREKIFFSALMNVMKASKITEVNARLTKRW